MTGARRRSPRSLSPRGWTFPPPSQPSECAAGVVCHPTGSVDTAVLVPTHPRLAVLGLIGYASSTYLTRVDLLTVVELTSRPSMWTSTETVHRPNLRATKVACALGYRRDIVSGTAVFTAALGPRRQPTSLSAAPTAHVRDLT